MERMKDWKSYQKILNRRKRKKNHFISSIKVIGFLIFFIILIYGFYRFFYFGKSYILTHSKRLRGTGIRHISFINNKHEAGRVGSNIFLNTGFSVHSLKTYFKYYPPIFNKIRDGHYIQKIDGYTIVYTIMPIIQKEAEKTFKKYAVPYGILVAINPDTGAILALSSHSRNQEIGNVIPTLITYPAGSLTKIITASAAIEAKGFYPGFNIRFNGVLYGTNKIYWKQGIDKGLHSISFSMAFAKSCDIAFGKVTGFYLGKSLLEKYFKKFYFNSEIPFILDIRKSEADIPNRFYQLELTGAGFKNVKITPLQAALISGVIINRGRLMKPYIIDKIIGPNGKTVYVHGKAKVMGSPITAKTASVLRQMMVKTITKGVGHPDFYNVLDKYMLPGITVGGKIGTISGNSPAGLYQWFTGFGEIGGKKIAVSSLVVENPTWKITGGGVAEKIIFAYFYKHNGLKVAASS